MSNYKTKKIEVAKNVKVDPKVWNKAQEQANKQGINLVLVIKG